MSDDTTTPVPEIAERPAQPYAGITRTVTMSTIGEIADRIPELIGWLGARGIEMAGAPFLRYHVIDMAGELTVEAGVPVAAAPGADGDVHPGELPAGRYATLTHRGHPDELADATARLLAWADDAGVRLDMSTGDDGEHWACRVEHLLTDPAQTPDPADWETLIALKVAEKN